MKVEVRVYLDRMEIVGTGENHTATPATPYRSTRNLVGYFHPAVECLREGLKTIGALRILKPKPSLVIRAMEMNEGGLSEVEKRVFLEIGHAAGGKKVSVV